MPAFRTGTPHSSAPKQQPNASELGGRRGTAFRVPSPLWGAFFATAIACSSGDDFGPGNANNETDDQGPSSGGAGTGGGAPGAGGVPLVSGDGGTSPGDGGASSSTGGSNSGGAASTGGVAGVGGSPSTTDKFGVEKLYPTIAGGREWYLPDNAHESSSEWHPSSGSRGSMTATNEPGVFHMGGGAGPRLAVKSPAGKSWFRNVEATAYFKLIERHDEGSYSGFQIIARGEWHLTGTRLGSAANDGVPPPPGTVAGPGYPLDPDTQYNAHCFAASYHGGVNRDGRLNIVKEVSHAGGYTGQHGNIKPFPPNQSQVPTGEWFGYKFVVQNRDGDTGVHMEAWLDLNADGNWQKIVERDDVGGWSANDPNIDGCGAPPFGYETDQIITWAGPYVVFRIDYLETDAKWFSAREIAPLP